ncbi:MmcQ/YjbR family DNA-binding protein [Sphingobacterium lumbrici]|uniref:MmcQ/YjbR family DNA-binding protein n=1 Tax=Sphingobacterium lumbrici TaxID=2559600 RepID=UPI0011289F14|nr:MmcQ/YjbR family DNA-binding protein [Sphingobacterium lumbrici]
MHIEELYQYCLEKKGVTEELPFGPDTLVFKVVGKVFLLVGLDQTDHLSFNVKCDPGYAIELRQQYGQTVVPGFHMNKKHWNTVYANRELEDKFLKKLIDHSYDLVVKALSKKLKAEVENFN